MAIEPNVVLIITPSVSAVRGTTARGGQTMHGEVPITSKSHVQNHRHAAKPKHDPPQRNRTHHRGVNPREHLRVMQ